MTENRIKPPQKVRIVLELGGPEEELKEAAQLLGRAIEARIRRAREERGDAGPPVPAHKQRRAG